MKKIFIYFLVLFSISLYSQQNYWHFAVVDSEGYTGDRVGKFTSIALDSNDYPHISYQDENNGDLKYAYWDGNSWQITTVDTENNTGNSCQLVLDANDQPHIAYSEEITPTHNKLKYAYLQASTWNISDVDEELSNGISCTALALDSNARPHIGYSKVNLHYAYWDGNQWQISLVDAAGDGDAVSIALDQNDFAYISYNIPNVGLKCASWTGVEWNINLIESGATGHNTSLTMDSNDYPHISYRDNLSHLRHARWNGSNWVVTVVDDTTDILSKTSIVVDDNDYPRIAYFDHDHKDLKYAYWDGSQWQLTVVDFSGNVGNHCSLALDRNFYPHISYRLAHNDNGDSDVKYAYASEARGIQTGWYHEIADSKEYTGDHLGKFASMKLDANNLPHISYLSEGLDGNEQLKYCHLDASGQWQASTVDGVAVDDDEGWGTCIAIDKTNYPHIAYRDNTNMDLKYARWNGNTWEISTIASEGDVGSKPALALDSNDYPHISYGNSLDKDLEYAYRDATGWHLVTLLSEGEVGVRGTSLALDSQDYPHISFRDNTKQTFNYGYKDATGWHFEVIETAVATGIGSRLVLDNDDLPHICYQDETDGYLLGYAHFDGLSWIIETVALGTNNFFASIAVDSQNQPHISFHDYQYKDLYYAQKSREGWDIQLIDYQGKVGDHSSIAIDSNDLPHIVHRQRHNYYDEADVKYTRYIPDAPREYPYMTFWAVNDETDGKLYWYTLSEGHNFSNIEGDIAGDLAFSEKDIEGLAVDSNGNLYLVNNYITSKIYKVPFSELDCNPNTPVFAQLIGDTGLAAGTYSSEITGLHFYQGVLYGIAKETQKIYDISVVDASITEIGVLDADNFRTDGLTIMEPLLAVVPGQITAYITKTQASDCEIWKIDPFPSGVLTHVVTLAGSAKVESLTSHPNGKLYAADDYHLYEITLGDPVNVAVLSGYNLDIEGMDFNETAEKRMRATPTLQFVPIDVSQTTGSSSQ